MTMLFSQKLTGANGSQVGVTRSITVYPGDKVKIEAYAKYYNPGGTPRVSRSAVPSDSYQPASCRT